MLDLTPRLSADNSIIASLAVAAFVVAIYQAKVGPVSDVHATEAYDGNLQAAVRKAGWVSVAAVAGMTVLAKDANIAILGGAAIILEELTYRHALMSNPQTGQLSLTPAAYVPAAGPQVDAAGTYTAAAG